MRRLAILVGACALLALPAPPAGAITNLYVAERGGETGPSALRQFAVAADGSLSDLGLLPLQSRPHDVAITPDGRFAYVTIEAEGAGAAIVQLARVGAGGRLVPIAGQPSVPAGGQPRGIVVDPQGTRVYSAHRAGNAIEVRAIRADGTLAAPATVALGRGAPPEFLALSPSGTDLYVAAGGDGPAQLLQFDVDPASGAVTPKQPAVVPWPAIEPPSAVGRMALTPTGDQLLATAATPATALARYAIAPAGGALVGGVPDGQTSLDDDGEQAVAISQDGTLLWAPSGPGTPPGRINQFAIAQTGVLGALAPASVPNLAGGPTGDADASPDQRTLYLGQDASVSEWSIAPGGQLSARASMPTGGPNAGLVVAPSQAPVASFTAIAAPAGQATRFDARASTDPEGSALRYAWSFGDGASTVDGGPTPAHVYTAPGDYTVTLTLTDADGTSLTKLWTGTQILRNGGSSARSARALTVAPAPGADPPPPPPPPPAPEPEFGRSVVAGTERGTIRVRLPGTSRYVPLGSLGEIPVGSIVDARRGRVRITGAVDARSGRRQSAVFHDWFFQVLQARGRRSVIEARLVNGSFAACPRRTAARARSSATLLAGAAQARSRRSKRSVRRLWGRGNGDFRTAGRRSSATVRGTWWLVEDRCDGTLTRVRTGRVDVRDVARRTTITLIPGRSYLARAP